MCAAVEKLQTVTTTAAVGFATRSPKSMRYHQSTFLSSAKYERCSDAVLAERDRYADGVLHLHGAVFLLWSCFFVRKNEYGPCVSSLCLRYMSQTALGSTPATRDLYAPFQNPEGLTASVQTDHGV